MIDPILLKLNGERVFQEWLLGNGSREDLIRWLVWNDGNGVYTDQDSEAEGYGPLTLNAARSLMREIIDRE